SGPTWNLLEPTRVASANGVTFAKQIDGSYLATGNNPQFDTYTITAPLPAGTFSAVLLECFPDPSLPNRSLGRYPNGNFVLTKVEAALTVPGDSKDIAVKFVRAEADYSQAGWHIDNVLGGDKGKGWAVDGPTKRDPRRALFATAE